MILVILMYAISASTFIISKSLLSYTTPLFLTGIRTLIAGSLFLSFLYLKKFTSIKKYIIPCLPIALFSFYISNTLKFWSLQHITTAQASLLSIIEPVFALIFSYVVCAETVTTRRILGIGVCMGGYSFLVLQNFVLTPIHLLATCIFILCIAASAYGAMHMRFLIRYKNFTPVMVNGISMLMGGMLALGTSLFLEKPLLNFKLEGLALFAGLLTIMIVVSNLLAYHLYTVLLKRYSAVLISCASFLRPFFTALYEWIFLLKPFPLYTAISAGVIVYGLVILLYAEETIPETPQPFFTQ